MTRNENEAIIIHEDGNTLSNVKSSSSIVSFEFLQQLPKVELHAHLNGCIRPSTLFALAEEKGVTLSSRYFQPSRLTTSKNSNDEDSDNDALLYNVMPRSLQDCFDMFAEIPKCVNDVPSLERITWEALEDFATDQIVYLELRTTPKVLNAECDKRMYVRTVLSVMERFEQQQQRMTCRLIIAMDRSLSEQEASENVDLAVSFFKDDDSDSRIVGVDLGGNPTRGDFATFRPHLERARRAGLRTTLHCAEVPCDVDPYRKEVQSVLEFCPDRLGHALLIPSSLGLSKRRIPVETCPTSNVMTLELAHRAQGHLVEGLKQHPQLAHWLDTNYPVCIGTDDPGVFDTTPTRELWLLCRAFGLDEAQVRRLVARSMEYAFCDDATKRRIKEKIRRRMDAVRNEC